MKLLLAQNQELSKQKETISALSEQGESAGSALERLKAKLDEKDAQIERLKRKLDEKDAQLASLDGRPTVDTGDGPGKAAAAGASGASDALEAECRALRAKVRDQDELMRRILHYLRERDAAMDELKKRRPIGTEAIPADKLPPRVVDFLRDMVGMLESFRAQISEKEAQLSALPYKNGGEE